MWHLVVTAEATHWAECVSIPMAPSPSGIHVMVVFVVSEQPVEYYTDIVWSHDPLYTYLVSTPLWYHDNTTYLLYLWIIRRTHSIQITSNLMYHPLSPWQHLLVCLPEYKWECLSLTHCRYNDLVTMDTDCMSCSGCQLRVLH